MLPCITMYGNYIVMKPSFVLITLLFLY